MEEELEVKLLDIDVESLKTQLKEKGARKITEENQVNITINSSKHPIDPNHGYLRIRSVTLISGEEYHEFTFKEQKSKDGIRENIEHTVKIDNPKSCLSILEQLGYDIKDQGTKHRESFLYKGARFDFDTWDSGTYPYPYVEIEVTHKGELDGLIDEFSLPRNNISTKSIAELKNIWKNKNKL
ncbi:MAG: class IV adenylate cyclase [Tissierellia bacterium]|nr:class IV adenylate cyclase [Tissierellia bacterium]